MLVRLVKLLNSPTLYSIFSCSLAIILGILVIYYGTDEGQAWTSESARRLQVQNQPIALPHLLLTNQNGKSISLKTLSSPNNISSLTLFEFIFTRCPTICMAMGQEFSKLQSMLDLIDKDQKIKLLSISFDHRDSKEDIKNYLARFSADESRWSSANFNDKNQLDLIMSRLGAIVIPEPDYGFVHNSAVYVMRGNEVIGIYDHYDQKNLLKVINQELQKSKAPKTKFLAIK